MRGSSWAADTHPTGAGGRAPMRRASCSMSYVVHSNHPSTGRGSAAGIFHRGLQLLETARNPARDRARGQVERLTDRLVALVAGEEPVEDLLAGSPAGSRASRAPSSASSSSAEPVVEARPARPPRSRPRWSSAQPVDARPPRQLRDPRPNRAVVAQAAELLEDLGEDVLEDVLGVLAAEPEALAADRVDVAREALDELVPRLVVARRGSARRAPCR